MRYALLSAHYRAPLDFSMNGVGEAKSALDSSYRAIEGASDNGTIDDGVLKALGDDLNTLNALARLHELARAANKGDDAARDSSKASAQLLGLLQDDPEAWLKGGSDASADSMDDAAIDAAISARKDAKANKDYAEADRIRDDLAAQGILLEAYTPRHNLAPKIGVLVFDLYPKG